MLIRFVETLAFHGAVMLASHIVLALATWFRLLGFPNSDIRREYRLALIPLSLFYSSIAKLFLLLLLTIWRPTQEAALVDAASPSVVHFLDDDVLDREWIVRNVLGGMAAGFGLRGTFQPFSKCGQMKANNAFGVVLDCPPYLIMVVILSGWGAKTYVAAFVDKQFLGQGDSWSV